MTTRNSGTQDGFADAVTAAIAEMDEEAKSVADDTTEPVVESNPTVPADDASDDESDEQTEEADESTTPTQEEKPEEVEELFGDADEGTLPLVPPDLKTLMVDVPGEDEQKSIQGLIDGFMKDRDYTQKSQVNAAWATENEQAAKLWQAFQDDPEGVARKIAVDTGLIAEGQGPVANVELSILRSSDEVEAEIVKRVDEAVGKHPAILAAQQVQVRDFMNTSFGDIEEKYDVKLGPKSRRAILVAAQEAGTPDLDLIFNAKMAQRETKATDADKLKAAAPSRPTGRTLTKTKPDEDGRAATIEEAFEYAQVELA